MNSTQYEESAIHVYELNAIHMQPEDDEYDFFLSHH